MTMNANPDYFGTAIRGLWSGIKLTIAGLLVGAIGGAVFGWHYAGDTGDTVGRFAHAFVYGLVGTVLTSTFLASMTALQALVAIVRVSRLIGLPLLGFLTFVAWHSISWLNRIGCFEYLGQAHVLGRLDRLRCTRGNRVHVLGPIGHLCHDTPSSTLPRCLAAAYWMASTILL